MSRVIALAYGVASYLAFLAVFLYAPGFVGNLLVPKSIDSGPAGSLLASALVDTLLLLLFAVPHSVMARPAFKRWWTGFVPPPVERSTYVLVSSLTLGLLFWQWQPMPSFVWAVTSPFGRWLLLAVFWLGWVVVLLDRRAPAVCRRDNGLCPHRSATRRAGFGRLPRRAVSRLSTASENALARSEGPESRGLSRGTDQGGLSDLPHRPRQYGKIIIST